LLRKKQARRGGAVGLLTKIAHFNFMSKRNFILLIIILALVIAGVFIFLLTRQNGTSPTGDNTGTNFGSTFNPFNTNNKPNPPKTTPPVDVSGYQPPAPAATPKLVKVSSMPIAGFTPYLKERLIDVPVVIPVDSETSQETPATTTPVPPTIKTTTSKTIKPTPPATEFASALRYVDRATGNIYETFADKIAERKFSTTVIPQVYEALFGNSANSVVMRYLKTDGRTIETFVGNLPKEILGGDTTGDNEIKGIFLPDNVKDMSISPDKGNLFYLFTSNDNMVGTTLNFGTNKKTQIFTSPFTEWLSGWPNNKTITLTTKPASGIPGYVYGINPINSKTLPVQIFGNVNGLTTLESPDGKMILYSDDTLSLSIYHTDTKVSTLAGVRTLPEKCVWGGGSDTVYCAVPAKIIEESQYPDAWYQGEESFSDQIWKINITSGNTTMIADPIEINGGEDIDGIKLALDNSENYLFFVNKKDSFLWELSLK
jgi:hypothetical protein